VWPPNGLDVCPRHSGVSVLCCAGAMGTIETRRQPRIAIGAVGS
jgi:hypothetical protein